MDRETIKRVYEPEVVDVPREKKTDEQLAQDRLKSIEDGLLLQSFDVVSDVISFSEISPDAEEPPREWLASMTPEAALRKFRRVQAGWRTQSDAPIGVRVAKDTLLGILKTRSNEKTAPQLNVQIVQLTASPVKQYKEIDEPDLSKSNDR